MAAERVVDLALDDVVGGRKYARGSCDPKEAEALLRVGDQWHDPVA